MNPLGEAKDRGFHRLTLRFADDAIEADYIAEHNRRAVRPLRVVICAFALALIAPILGELYGFLVEGWTGFDVYLRILPLRLAAVAMLFCALALTWAPWAVRNGQGVVTAGALILIALQAPLIDTFGPWIMLNLAYANFGLTLLIVASGLLFRRVVPLALIGTGVIVFAATRWMENPFAPLMMSFATLITLLWVAYSIERARRLAWAGAAALADEKALTERLLLSVLPPSIATRMRGGETLIADSHDEATVVFADIANFTPLSASMPAEALVEILDEIFAAFDEVAERHDLEKIKTIGDAYMMAAGLPNERSRDPASALRAALEMRGRLEEIAGRRGIDVKMRAGVHIGPVVAGVIGRSKFVYDLWGDSVNVASRMESTAPIGEIQVTEAVFERLGEAFEMTPRGEIEVKGKGPMKTWLLAG
ncbi:MAG: adenylate/guanylate cyclase domain-containing protein [Pseudomonadota bacterium]